mgnify:CR=1 FL=1
MTESNNVTVDLFSSLNSIPKDHNYTYKEVNTESQSFSRSLYQTQPAEKEFFFGENIREASNALKRIFKK